MLNHQQQLDVLMRRAISQHNGSSNQHRAESHARQALIGLQKDVCLVQSSYSPNHPPAAAQYPAQAQDRVEPQ